MKVSKLLKMHGMLVLTVHPDFTLAEAARRFTQSVGGRRFSLAVVTNHDDQVLGVISLGDISHALGQHEEKAAKMLVKDVMTTDVTACSLDDDLEDVLRRMADKEFGKPRWWKAASSPASSPVGTRWSSSTSKHRWTRST